MQVEEKEYRTPQERAKDVNKNIHLSLETGIILYCVYTLSLYAYPLPAIQLSECHYWDAA